MEYAVVLIPLVLGCLGVGLAFGLLSLALGTAPFIVPVFLGAQHTILSALGLLVAALILSLFSPLRKSIDWTDVARLSIFVFVGAGIAYYFSFQFYFRYSASFLFLSALIWLVSSAFCPRTVPDRQFTFFPFFSNVTQGFLAGAVVGALGFAGFPLLVPFLQIFRKMDRPSAAANSLPLVVVILGAMLIVMFTPRAAFGPLFSDPSYDRMAYLLIGGTCFVGLILGISFGKKLLKPLSPLVISFGQLLLILSLLSWGWLKGKTHLPCLSKNPFNCLTCFNSESSPTDWKKFTWADSEQNFPITVVINSCGQPLGLEGSRLNRSDFVVKLPASDLNVGINQETGKYSDAWEGSRMKRARQQRVYFDRPGCQGGAATSRRKLETQVGVTSIFNDEWYRDVTEARSAFWYASYRDAKGECANQSGMIKASKETGVYALSSNYRPTGREPILDEECCIKFLEKDSFISTLYYSDEECQGPGIATDDDGPAGVEKSVLFHQDKYYLIKSQMPFFEYRSYKPSGKDCVKREGILSPMSERLAYSVEEVPRPQDFSQHLPLSSRALLPRDLRFWN